MPSIKDLLDALENNTDKSSEGGHADAAGTASSSSGSGGGFKPETVSVADQIRQAQEVERAVETEEYKTEMEAGNDVDTASPMASIAAAAMAMNALFDKNPATDNNINVDMTHVAVTAAALAIVQPKADMEGQNWKHSEAPVTYKFSDNQVDNKVKNDVKLEDTKDAVTNLAQTHMDLKGAIQDIKVDRYNGANTASNITANKEETFKSPSAFGVTAGAAAGWGAGTIADMLMPGLGAPIRLASTAMTGAQSMAVVNAAMGGGSTNYDAMKKPKSKAEAAAMKDKSSSYFSSNSNVYNNSTSGGTIEAPKKASKSAMAFNDAATSTKGDPAQHFKSSQIALLETAAAKVFKQGEDQTGHLKNAEIADDAHENYISSGGAEFDLGEKLRALKHGAGTEVQKSTMIAASQLESPERAEKVEKALGLDEMDLTFGRVFKPTNAPKPV